jgi:hypothetical protein
MFKLSGGGLSAEETCLQRFKHRFHTPQPLAFLQPVSFSTSLSTGGCKATQAIVPRSGAVKPTWILARCAFLVYPGKRGMPEVGGAGKP